jgi:cellulose synthase operon protein B
MIKQKLWFYRPSMMWSLTIVFLAAMILFMSTPVESKSRKAKEAVEKPVDAVEAEKAPAPKGRLVSMTLKQLGAWSAIKLRGVDGLRTLGIPVRADEVVVAAKLSLVYDFSPSIRPDLSSLKVSVNSKVAMLEPLPSGNAKGVKREVNLNPAYFNDNNNYLNFEFQGMGGGVCPDPFSPLVWLTISEESLLVLTLAPSGASYNLRDLPAPFFDSQVYSQLNLPFVFGATPSFGTLKAAGVVASWFGMQAGSRGAQFPVSLNSLPDSDAVVFLQGGETIDGVKGAKASTVSLQPHPTNPNAKLLVFTGSTDEEIARAANSVALAAPTLSGQIVTLTKETEAQPRKPYDAPAWVPMDRPVRFGELAKLEELRVQAYYPPVIRLNYRISPDVFTWRTAGAPVQLKYRATRLPLHQNSSLNVSANENFIQSYALNELDKKTSTGNPQKLPVSINSGMREEALFIPPYATTGRDQFQFAYYFDITRLGLSGTDCPYMPPNNLQGAVDPESTVDFSSFPHYAALPNLAYFANIGFPYTRMADLSESAVVLPARPNADEVGVFLTVMGKMGESTGYPVVRLALIAPPDIDKMSDKDLIVIGSANSQSLMSKWVDHLPIAIVDGERKVRKVNTQWLPSYRWEQQDVKAVPKPNGDFTQVSTGSMIAVMAFESPLKAGRSVVVLYADKASGLQKLSELLTDPERAPSIQGDFVVVENKKIFTTKVSDTYYTGSLSPISKVRWFLSDQPLLLGLLSLLVCLVLAALAYRPLRRIIAKRKQKIA